MKPRFLREAANRLIGCMVKFEKTEFFEFYEFKITLSSKFFEAGDFRVNKDWKQIKRFGKNLEREIDRPHKKILFTALL